MIVAVVLAAGRSRRLGHPKPLLPCRQKTFLEAVLETVAASRADEARIVLGHRAQTIRRELGLKEGTFVVNPDYDAGMLSSVQCGIRTLAGATRAFLIWPVDHPLVARATVDKLVDEFLATEASVVLPVYEGKRGHPVLFHAALAAELMNAAARQGARAVVHAHAHDRIEVPVGDCGVVTDIDTPEVYERVFGRTVPAWPGRDRSEARTRC